MGERDIVRAIDGVSIDIYQDDVLALVGESGCGKTTLGKVAIGLQRPTNGSVRYREQDIWDAKEGTGNAEIPYSEIRRNLQIIHQDPGSSLNPHRTILASISEVLRKWRPDMSAAKREEVIHLLLDRIGLEPAADYASRYPHQLSGGEQQRVALARALVMRPSLILADEAVSALDVSLRVEMMDLMLELQDIFSTSYIFVSHDFANARYFAKKTDGRIGVMYLGELVEIGPAEEVIFDPKHPYTKVLAWASPVIDPDESEERANQEPPVRTIDIPDAKNPPSGCRFHTRCPEAREVCKVSSPDLMNVGNDTEVACFRHDDAHEYWESDELTTD